MKMLAGDVEGMPGGLVLEGGVRNPIMGALARKFFEDLDNGAFRVGPVAVPDPI